MAECVALKFGLATGCLHVDDVDQIQNVPAQVKERAKKVVKHEVNAKIKHYKINMLSFGLLPLGMVSLIAGAALSFVLFPYNFILIGFGFVTLTSFGVYVLYKKLQWPKFYVNAIKSMEKQTNGQIRLEPVYVRTLVYHRKGMRTATICTHFLVKTRLSAMNAQRFLAGGLGNDPANRANPANPLSLLSQAQPGSINMQPNMAAPTNMVQMQHSPHQPQPHVHPHGHSHGHTNIHAQFSYQNNPNAFHQKTAHTGMTSQSQEYSKYNVIPNPQMTQSSMASSNLTSHNVGNVSPLTNRPNYISKQNNVSQIPSQPYRPHPNFRNQTISPQQSQNLPGRVPFQNSNQPNLAQQVHAGHRLAHGGLQKSPFVGNNFDGHPQENVKMVSNVREVVSPNARNAATFYALSPQEITNLDPKK